MGLLTRLSKKNVASENILQQIFGALIQWQWKSFLIFILLILFLAGVSFFLSPEDPMCYVKIFLLTLGVWWTLKVCRVLTNTFSLRKKETGITFCQIFILVAIGIWIIGFLIVFDIQNRPRYAAALGIIGTLVGWIFQDRIKGVVAFLHLRMHHLLCIGDWIEVPSLNADGEVQRITLTSVIIYNWDTTTSTIPINALHDDHFINYQRMCDGKTFGRQMKKNFILDTGCFHAISSEEAERLRHSEKITDFLPEAEVKEGVINARLFRLYLYHWLMNHPHVSQQPQLVVRWMEERESGMPLQVYIFIIDSTMAAYERQQSQIIEHLVESLEWFGLRLYQSPSSYDVSRTDVTIHNVQEGGQL